MDKDAPVTEIVDTLDNMVQAGPVETQHLVDSFGRDAIAPALLVPALLIVSPLSAIPLFPTLCSLVIIIIALQGASGRTVLWLPEFIAHRRLPQEKIQRATGFLYRLADWLDWLVRERLPFIIRPPVSRILYLACAIVACIVPLLELVPMLSTVIGAGVACVAVGILARDGVVALCGMGLLGIGSLLPFFAFSAAGAVIG